MIQVFRRNLVAGQEQKFIFDKEVTLVTILNLSPTDGIYLAINDMAEIDGERSLLVPAGLGRDIPMDNTSNSSTNQIQYVSVVSEGNPLIQVDGIR